MARTRNGYGAQRKNYKAELVVEILTGAKDEFYTNAAMQHGIDYEPVARTAYELESGNTVQDTGFWVDEELGAGASPDGFVGEDGLLEIKCPNTATHLETLEKKEVPYQYRAQVQGQMWITGRKWCDFVSYDPRLPENAQMIIIHVERDDDYIKNLAEEVETFMIEVVEQVEFVRSYK
jgi:putative phage-type endonuclease